jgi:hypothetical protein
MPLAVLCGRPSLLQIISFFCGFMVPSLPLQHEKDWWSEFKNSTGLPFHSVDDVGIGAAWHRVGICR